jgi:hypothetical protein
VPKQIPILCAVAVLSAPASLRAQTRPLLTEEAFTAPGGALRFELGADAIADEPNFLTGQTRDRLDVPTLRLTWSPASNVELDVDWVVRVIAVDDPYFGDVSDFGDVSLRAKVRFAEGAGGRRAFGARFAVTLPQTSYGNGLGSNTLRFSAQLLFSQRIGGLTFHANAGLAIHDEAHRAHEQRDFLAYGLALEQAVGGSFAVLAEVAGLAGDGMPGTDAHSEARAGVRYGRGRLRLDAAVRRGLAEADGEWGFTAGLSWRLNEGT